MLLLLAAVPGLFWDAAPDTAPKLRDAGVKAILVPAARLTAWKQVADITVSAADPQSSVKLLAPNVNYRINEASATTSPWIVANGWKLIRRPQGRYYYDVPGSQAALSAAEAFCYGVNAMIRTDADGLKPLAAMLEFLASLGDETLPPVADIGFLDDGSAASGEVMNLMVRNNLLFRPLAARDSNLKINVKLGTREYPLEDAKNPGKVAHEIRHNLTDEKRSLRIYGSQVVVARLTAGAGRARVHLLNYAGAERKVNGIRVRVLGQYPKGHLSVADGAGIELLDYQVDADATEFTVPELKTYAVIDLSR